MSETYKVVVLGSGGVGKSRLTMKFIQRNFVEKYEPTTINSYRKQVVVDGQLCTLDILDTVGQDEYRPIRVEYIRTGQAFIFVYDITDANSLDYISMLQVRMEDEEQRPVLVLGNKSDLQVLREISYEDGQKFAQTFKNCEFLETSAKEGTNVDEAFKCITRKLLKKSRKEKNIRRNGASCVLS